MHSKMRDKEWEKMFKNKSCVCALYVPISNYTHKNFHFYHILFEIIHITEGHIMMHSKLRPYYIEQLFIAYIWIY